MIFCLPGISTLSPLIILLSSRTRSLILCDNSCLIEFERFSIVQDTIYRKCTKSEVAVGMIASCYYQPIATSRRGQCQQSYVLSASAISCAIASKCSSRVPTFTSTSIKTKLSLPNTLNWHSMRPLVLMRPGMVDSGELLINRPNKGIIRLKTCENVLR
jgi:hypothetical protein